MGWIPLKRHSVDMDDLLNERATSFANKHQLGEYATWRDLHYDLQFGDPSNRRLWYAWLKRFQRATETHATGVAYGYIGYSSKY